MKRVGIVSTWFERGAGYVSRQFKSVLERQHAVFVYARGGEYAKGDPNWDGPDVTWAKRNPIATTAVDIKDFERWLDRNAIEIVIFNEQKWWDPILLCNRKGVLNGAYVDYYTEETIPILGLHDFLICNTKKHQRAFEWHPQAHYVPWGTDTALFSPESAEKHLAHLLDDENGTGGNLPCAIRNRRPDDVWFFQSAGVVPDRKGTDLLLRAFALIEHPAARLLLHTQTDVRAALPELRGTIDHLVDGGRLALVEDTITAPGLYGAADVYVYPSRLEGIGLTVPEAISCGLPTIVPDDGPMNEFPSPACGALVPPVKLYSRADAYYWPQNEVEPVDLAQTMESFIDGSRDVDAMKRAARKHALSTLDWDTNATVLPGIIAAVSPGDAETKVRATERAEHYNRRRKVWLKERIRRIPILRSIL